MAMRFFTEVLDRPMACAASSMEYPSFLKFAICVHTVSLMAINALRDSAKYDILHL